MKILWTHNFSPENIVAGNFMYILARGMQELGLKIDLEYLGNLRSPSEFISARRRVRELSAKYDLVHAQFGSACAFASADCYVPNIVTLRGSDWHVYKGRKIGAMLHNYLAFLLSRISLQKFDEVIVMSNRMAAEVRLVLEDKNNVYVIPDALDDKFFKRIDKKEARTRLGQADNNKLWVLFTTVSIDNPVKRASLAMNAFNYAKNKCSEIELRIASGISPGDMPTFVSACDIVLCTSSHEGWPNSVKEALACGLPFVATDVSDLQLIADMYPSCRVVQPDPMILGENILQVLKSGQVEGLSKAVDHMNVLQTCNEIRKRYISILS